MRALVLSVAVLISAAASAQSQGLARPPPPGQPTGPVTPQPAPAAPIPGYNNSPGNNKSPGDNNVSGYDDFDFPENFRRRGPLAVLEREQMIERMARVETLLAQAANDRGGRRLRETLRKLREEMNEMRYEVTNAPDLRSFRRRPGSPPPPPQPQVYPISEDKLQSLIRAINKEPFGDAKLQVIESAAPTQYFLVPQVTKLLQRFSFGEDKLDVVRVLWPRVLDRENGYQLYQSFSFANEKEQLRQILDS